MVSITKGPGAPKPPGPALTRDCLHAPQLNGVGAGVASEDGGRVGTLNCG
jgi:hypothetical protein